jgi:hypothetical protein
MVTSGSTEDEPVVRTDGTSYLRRDKTPAALGCLLIVQLMLIGCAQDAKLGRVHGTVRLDGKPVAKGSVQFIPDSGHAAVGAIQSDGTYSLGTQGRSDCAFLGVNKVAIISYDAAPIDGPPYMTPNHKSTPLIPERYMSTATSKLTFEVKPGDNEANFDLSGK